jgi:hypothetical protein
MPDRRPFFYWLLKKDCSKDSQSCEDERNMELWLWIICRLVDVVVIVLANGPKGCGFKTRPKRWIFKDDKIPQHTFLSDGK